MADATTSADAAAAPRGETIEERIDRTRSQHTCIQRFDHFMYCFTPVNQLRRYYHDATYDYCPALLEKWRNCLRVKLSSQEEGAAILEREWRASVRGEHVWQFKPEYDDEALRRYGVRPYGVEPSPSAAGVT